MKRIRRHTAKLMRRGLTLLLALNILILGGPTAVRAANCGDVLVEGSSWAQGHGVDVHHNGEHQTTGVSCGGSVYNLNADPPQYGSAWQCVELASRLYNTQGWHSGTFGVNYASQIYGKATANSWSVMAQGNIDINQVKPGDMLISSEGTYGHVMIVDRIEGNTIKAVDQNGSAGGRVDVSFSGGSISAGSYYEFTGVVHDPENKLNTTSSTPPGEGGGNTASWSTNRLDAFIRGTDNRMWQKWYAGGPNWQGYALDPGNSNAVSITSQPAAVSWAPGRIDVFARSSTNSLIHKYYLEGAGWNPWADLGGCIVGEPTVTTWGVNRLDVFVQGCNSTGLNMHHKWYNGSWQPWELTPNMNVRIASPPSAVSWGQNRIDIFARGEGADLIHNYYDGSWHGIDTQGGCIIGQPAAASWGPGRLDAFVQGCNTTGPNVHQRTYANNAWQSWLVVPVNNGYRVTNMLGAVSWGANRIDMFARGLDGAMLHKYYLDGAGWNPWSSLGGSLAAP